MLVDKREPESEVGQGVVLLVASLSSRQEYAHLAGVARKAHRVDLHMPAHRTTALL